MRVKFKYKGIEYYPKDLDKKLKQLGITLSDIAILNNEEKPEEVIEYKNPKLFIFKNKVTGYTIESIYSDLEYLKTSIKNLDDYKYIGIKEY